ncbi:hypothetical protein Tco_1533507 [Tanacetum coccineum]
MTKVIKGEFEKIKDVKVEDVSLTCNTPFDVFNDEVRRLSKMDNDLFTYEVEVANIPCNSKIDDDSEHEADDDMGYDPTDVAFIEWLGSIVTNERCLPDRPISNLEDVFSSNFPNYVPPASPDYVPTSPGKTYSSASNSFGIVPLISPTLLLFPDDLHESFNFHTENSPIPVSNYHTPKISIFSPRRTPFTMQYVPSSPSQTLGS